MKKLITLCVLLFITFNLSAQEAYIYATMDLGDAQELMADFPQEVEILAKKQNEAAVYMSVRASEKLHDRVLVHGPGYIFKRSSEEAIAALNKKVRPANRAQMAFTITEDAWVEAALNVVNTQNIEDQILELQNYGTRYHNRAAATQAAIDLKAKWEAMAVTYGRTDVSVRLYNHVNTQMPSVIMTITGSETPSEFVVVGGHLDSTANPSNDNAPGADDDASGIATITEATRALFEVGFVPKKTIEVMAYAAEEIGLVGSSEIAEEYNDNNVNVIAVVQFDMTNYNGSANDVSLITDFTDASVNSFLMQLMDHYNDTGSHQFTYATSLCNYGCSDHASWTSEGYMSAFPFEANFGQHNPNIHSANDVFSISGTATHAAKFAKLCAEFLIETSKGNTVLAVDENALYNYTIYVDNAILNYSLDASQDLVETIVIYDILGKSIKTVVPSSNQGYVSLEAMANGFYIVSLRLKDGTQIAKKIILQL